MQSQSRRCNAAMQCGPGLMLISFTTWEKLPLLNWTTAKPAAIPERVGVSNAVVVLRRNESNILVWTTSIYHKYLNDSASLPGVSVIKKAYTLCQLTVTGLGVFSVSSAWIGDGYTACNTAEDMCRVNLSCT